MNQRACLALLAVLGAACGGPSRPRTTAPAPGSSPSGPPVEVATPEPERADPEAPAPQPPAPQPPTPQPPAPGPPGRESAPQPLRMPLSIRIGLASDLPFLTLPFRGGELWWEDPDSGATQRLSATPHGPLRVEPLVGGGIAVYRLQVAALKDAERAQSMAAELATRTGLAAEAHFDASVGLYRVRVGRFASREAAEAGRSRVPWAGGGAAFVVSETARLVAPGLRLSFDGKIQVIAGRWLSWTAGAAGEVVAEGRRYRHSLRVYLNDRGSLNLINELPFEEYLRGVVPKEMGPEQYDRLEALKAQAVAARTYAVAHLGQFELEGFDLCATPSCQVYGGLDAEHPVSDRAVAETASEVMVYQGKPIEALYTATCGGHTEDVAVVFPEKRAPYLAGLPCIEGGATVVPTALPAGTPLPSGVIRRLLLVTHRSAPAAFAERAERLAALAGLEVPRVALASLEGRDVVRYLVSLFDLVLAPSLFAPTAGSGELQVEIPLGRSLSEAELDGMLLRLAQRLGVVAKAQARFSHLEKAALWVMEHDQSRRFPLSGAVPAFRGVGARATAGSLSLMPGDPLELWLSGGQLVAISQPTEALRGAAGRVSAWTRFKSRKELADQVEQRYPGLGFEGFEVLSRGRSGRVGKIRLLGRGGRVQEVEGLAVRWLLDVPETLFTVREVHPAKGPSGWQFTGKGWGHGVGLCQTGAFGMAGRGLTYRDILLHYYSGTELVRVEPWQGR